MAAVQIELKSDPRYGGQETEPLATRSTYSGAMAASSVRATTLARRVISLPVPSAAMPKRWIGHRNAWCTRSLSTTGARLGGDAWNFPARGFGSRMVADQ